jgi:hypothetical protein
MTDRDGAGPRALDGDRAAGEGGLAPIASHCRGRRGTYLRHPATEEVER